VRVSAKKGHFLEQRFKKGFLLNFGNGLVPDDPDLRIPLEDFGSVRSSAHISSEVLSGRVASHVAPCFPPTTLTYVIDLAFIGDINGSSFLAVFLCKFLEAELGVRHIESPLSRIGSFVQT
jgi:hypothetical protein